VRAVVQRVRTASVSVDGEEVSRIGRGALVLLGVAAGDGGADVSWLARKIAGLRIFSDDAGKMNLSVDQIGGSLLVVSQFTLLGDCRAGRRPGFSTAAPPEEGRRLYEVFLAEAADVSGVPVRAGVFGAEMVLALENEGPATFILDTRVDRR